MKVLVTGATGFIGSHLVEALHNAGKSVRALAHYNSRGLRGHLDDLDASLLKSLDIRMGDIADPHFVRELVIGCDVVFHLAALIAIPYSYHAPASYVATNVGGTLNILEACRQARVGRLIVTSTSEVYGTARHTPIVESHPLQAQSPYAASKIAADKLAESYYCSFDLPVVTLRPFNTYGPRQSARAIIPTVLSQALHGSNEIQIGNPAPRRDLTFVSDTVRAFLLAAEVPGLEGQVVHFGQGEAISIGDLARRCIDIVGGKARVVSVQERLRPEKSEVDLLLCNPAKASKLIGWQPRIDLNEGLRLTADFVRSHLHLYPSYSYQL
jgi:NAD dependent epimerase/dehydratase